MGWLPAPASRGRGRAHRVFHPLAGADLRVLAGLLAEAGPIPPGRWHVPVLALATAIGRLPFTLAEAAASHWLPGKETLPAPVFVVGYWRSGTTHLSNLLSRHDGFGILPPIAVGLPQEALGLARLVRPFIEQFYPKTRLIDGVPLAPDLPQEDELAIANLSPWSFYHGVYFPRRAGDWLVPGLFLDGAGPEELRRLAATLERYLVKMTVQQGRRPLLVRNPAHSARIGLIRSIWPDARFIHVHRDPLTVYASAVRMFRTLFQELAIQGAEVDVEALVLETYPALMGRLLQDFAVLPPGLGCTVRFEDVECDPLGQLERIFTELNLPGFEDGLPKFQAHLRAVASYRKAEHRLPPDEITLVQRHWRPFIERWGSPMQPAATQR
ncbi:sulfotransferase family protein [Geminicoccus harenae]|uniref:sulfotransferase family protein n=1 Tax=Geminicoccus harenae TaxID=2498453 RepID=UPI00168B6B36|nr:sulfotransferase [Geminicoccus harenae]